PLPHFSIIDTNWPYGPDPLSQAPNQSLPASSNPDECSSEEGGSIIECHNQVLGESLPITGVPFGLHYRSSRTPGFAFSRQFKVPLTVGSPTDSATGVNLGVAVAGRDFFHSFNASPGQSYSFVDWDGKDPQGNKTYGTSIATVKITRVYPTTYQTPDQQT